MTAPSPNEHKVSCTRCWVYMVQLDTCKSHSIPSSLCKQMVTQKAASTPNGHPAHSCSYIRTCPCSVSSQEDAETLKSPSLYAASQNPELLPPQPASLTQTPVFNHIVSLMLKHSVFCGDQKEQNKWFQNTMLPIVDPDKWRHSGMHNYHQHLQIIKTTDYQCYIQ